MSMLSNEGARAVLATPSLAMSPGFDRRQFLRASASIAAAFGSAPGFALPASGLPSADPLPLGGLDIGSGGVETDAYRSLPAESRVSEGFWASPRKVWLRRPDTREEIRATFWADGRLLQGDYERICWFLRDRRMQSSIQTAIAARGAAPPGWYSVIGMSLHMLNTLYALGAWLEWFGMPRALIVTSAFRHPATNARTEGAARNSMHQLGRAIDLVVPDVSSNVVGKFSVWLNAGGVGFYPGRGFTHIDDGRLRTWRG